MADVVRTLVRFAVATLLLAVGLVLSGGAAQASCGDHVRIVTPTAGEDVPVPPMPCHGPNCSSAPPRRLPASMPTKTVQPPTEWAATATDTLPLPDATSGRVVGDADGRPVRISSAPFHPPRSR